MLLLPLALSAHAVEERPAPTSSKMNPAGYVQRLNRAMQSLLEPGPLARPHAKLDDPAQCGQCHSQRQGLEREKCLACHKQIKARLEKKEGYHGMLSGDCWTCHSDHKGREVKLVNLDEKAFNHRLAAFSLRGAHEDLACPKCHGTDKGGPKGTTGRKYIGLPKNCSQCHKDPHQGKVSADCAKCHNESSWTGGAIKFDHSKTRFPLTGRHGALACGQCHEGGKFKVEPLACATCHKDPHQGQFRGQFRQACDRCHSTDGWTGRGLIFDHQKTRFPLRDKHATLACATCHQAGQYRGRSASCSACHHDPHRGQFKEQFKEGCAKCHTSRGWGVRELHFDHQATGFPLTGAHRGVACGQCHTEGRYHEAPAQCGACHIDPHEGRTGSQCHRCHETTSWTAGVRAKFNHAATPFPLDRTHRALGCAACHEPVTLKTPGRRCTDCHSDVEKFYRGAFMAERLEGAKPDPMHGKVACAQCHGPEDQGVDLQAILNRCEKCHPPQYADLAVSWMAIIHKEGREAARRLAEKQARGKGRDETEAIRAITRLAPHNFQHANRLLKSLGAGDKRH